MCYTLYYFLTGSNPQYSLKIHSPVYTPLVWVLLTRHITTKVCTCSREVFVLILGPEDVSLSERCPHFRGWYVQASMELGPEDVSLLERCPHFRGCNVQASMELGPEDVSLLEKCPHFRG